MENIIKNTEIVQHFRNDFFYLIILMQYVGKDSMKDSQTMSRNHFEATWQAWHISARRLRQAFQNLSWL
jgi:hypothetical protein